jgi:hypothetical protein
MRAGNCHHSPVLTGGIMNANIKILLKQIDKRMQGVADERDKLDDLISTLDDLKEHCRQAYDSLTEARDVLSQLV